MSHKWATNAYDDLSKLKMREVQAVIHKLPWMITHNNVNLLVQQQKIGVLR
jgi:hypothetical protein